MPVLAEFSIVPVGTGVSVSPVIAKVLKIVVDSGIRYKANAMGTVLEGEWNEIMGVIRKCHDEALKHAGRVLTDIRIDDYQGKTDRLEKKLASVEEKMGVKLNR